MSTKPCYVPYWCQFQRVQLLLPANQQSALAKKTDPNTFHTTRRKSQRKNHPVNLPPHQLQKWSGGEGTPYHVGRMQHIQDSNTSHGMGASAPMLVKDTATGWVGTQAPCTGLLTPKGTPEVRGNARFARRKAPSR